MQSLKIADIIESLSTILENKSELLFIFGTYQIDLDMTQSAEICDRLGDLYQHQRNKDNRSRKLNSKRNKQGMFYSPNYIVQFMVERALKQQTDCILESIESIWEDRHLAENGVEFSEQAIFSIVEKIHEISVLDPACGSGIFLISAIRWFISFYKAFESRIEKFSSRSAIQKKINESLIASNFLKRYEQIITRHIFGIDIDPISIDITKINVFLELLLFLIRSGEPLDENKINEVAAEVSQWLFFKDNLKIGNVLLSFPVWEELNILSSKQKGNLTAKDIEARISQHFTEWLKPKGIGPPAVRLFSWFHAFPIVFLENRKQQKKENNLGFSCVIGNPPWGASLGVDKKYVLERFQYKIDNINSFELFILLGMELLKPDGLLSFIIPRNFVKTNDYIQLREILLKNYQIELIADIGCSFKQVAQESVILSVKKSKSNEHQISFINNFDLYLKNQENYEFKRVLQSEFLRVPDYIINPNYNECIEAVLKKIEGRDDVVKLGDLVEHGRGIEYGKNGTVALCPSCNNYCDPPTKKHSEKICPFCAAPIPLTSKVYQIISDKKDDKHIHPIFVGKHLSRYHLKEPFYLDINVPGIRYKDAQKFAKKKILLMKISESIKATIDYSGAYITQALYYLIQKSDQPTLEHILGILNSKLMAFYYEHRFNVGASITTNVTLANILRLPIFRNNNSQLETFVKELISTKKNIEKLEEKIDELVFRLYELNEKDIEFIRSFEK